MQPIPSSSCCSRLDWRCATHTYTDENGGEASVLAVAVYDRPSSQQQNSNVVRFMTTDPSLRDHVNTFTVKLNVPPLRYRRHFAPKTLFGKYARACTRSEAAARAGGTARWPPPAPGDDAGEGSDDDDGGDGMGGDHSDHAAAAAPSDEEELGAWDSDLSLIHI